MTFSITEDIRSITELKRNTNSVLDQIHKTKRPVVLTKNGKAAAVILDSKEYEKITQVFNLLKLLIPAEKDISSGKYKEAKDFFKEFKRANMI
jgi:prevent-host-death family protein